MNLTNKVWCTIIFQKVNMSDLRVRRLLKELEMVRSETSFIEDVQICDGNVGKWQVICCTCFYCSHNTYKQVILKSCTMPDYLGAVAMIISFPAEYPFKPPSISIPTIFHPNVYVTGKLCIR